MTTFSFPKKQQLLFYFLGSAKKKVISSSILVIIVILIHFRNQKSKTQNFKLKKSPQKGKGNVDQVFIKRIMYLLKIVIPKYNCPQILDICLLTISLVLRTFLSIYLAGVNGRIVKAIIKMDFNLFIRRIISLGLIAIPASFINSYLDYLNKSLAIKFRKSLTNYFHQRYLKDMIFYQLTNLDNRVSNPDQRLTTDIEKWANSLSMIYSNFSKPVLDIILFSRKLSELVGWKGPLSVISWYLLSGVILRIVSPPFGKLTAIEQRLQGQYRSCHSQLVFHSQEVAFYKGNTWQKSRINDSFQVVQFYQTLMQHSDMIHSKKLFMGVFDSMLVKYGAVMVGYAIVGLPVFGPGSQEYLKKIGNDPGAITRDYVRNSSLLINLAKAIGRLVVSYKEIQQLAGFTTLVYQLKQVLDDLHKGKFQRIQVNQDKQIKQKSRAKINEMTKGKYIETSDSIIFQNVPIISPNGDVLVQGINFQITPGMNCIISGPNGCGKSSLFRILSRLWPLPGGKLHCPHIDKLFYIPQRPYLPAGNLRDQIIYPHNKLTMLRRGIKDEDIKKFLQSVKTDYIIDRQGGFDAVNDWKDVLSGGQKQRIAMARLFYHKPLFAILDECTSAVSMDVEAVLYTTAKKLGITLFTVSHRTSLFKFHEYLLRFDGQGLCEFRKLEHE